LAPKRRNMRVEYGKIAPAGKGLDGDEQEGLEFHETSGESREERTPNGGGAAQREKFQEGIVNRPSQDKKKGAKQALRKRPLESQAKKTLKREGKTAARRPGQRHIRTMLAERGVGRKKPGEGP